MSRRAESSPSRPWKEIFLPEKFEKEEMKEIKVRTTNPERGYYVKDERTKQFAYSFHAAMNLKKLATWSWQSRQKIVARSVLLSLMGTICNYYF